MNHSFWNGMFGGIVTVFIMLGIAAIIVLAGEPVQKADDTFYDRALVNWMIALGVPKAEAKEIIQLPTSPEIDLETLWPMDSTRWFFVTEGYQIGIIYQYVTFNGSLGERCDSCALTREVIFDLRGKDE